MPGEPPRNRNNETGHARPAFNRSAPTSRPAPTFRPAPMSRPRMDDRNDRFERDSDDGPTLLAGRNPIREALKNGQDIDKLLVAKGDISGTANQIIAMARERGVVVQYVDRRKLDEMVPAHQGLIAQVPAHPYATIADMLALAKQREEAPIIVVLDGVTDPHNLGAIIRCAEAFGAHGVVLGKRRASGLTPIAVKASAGAAMLVPVARVTNISAAVEELKAAGLWAIAGVMSGKAAHQAKLRAPLCIVVGDEGTGVSRIVEKACDEAVSIPMFGKIASLNAGVAAGILLYESTRA